MEHHGWNAKPVDPWREWSDHGARWHATSLGRWTAADPPLRHPKGLLEHGLGASTYGFVAGNPVGFWDPDGNQTLTDEDVTGRATVMSDNDSTESGLAKFGLSVFRGLVCGYLGGCEPAHAPTHNNQSTVRKSTELERIADTVLTVFPYGVLAKGVSGSVRPITGGRGTGLLDDGVRAVDDAGNAAVGPATPLRLSPAAQRSIRSLENRVAEHIEKLNAYKKNPYAFDNRGDLLRNSGRPDIQQRIIRGRIQHLEGEIRNFRNAIERLRSGEFEP